MTPFNNPIDITLNGETITIIGTDTGSYVSSDGRTWLHPEQPGNTPEDIAAHIQEVVENPPVIEQSKEELWKTMLAGFIHDDETEIDLSASENASRLFSSLEALLNLGMQLGYITEDMPVTVKDHYDQEHVLTVEDCRDLLYRYGVAWHAMYLEYAS